MDDKELLARINGLVEEEHRLERTHGESGLSGDEQQRLRQIEIQLDQCWDLLRQRRARRSVGDDPDSAQARTPEIVEHYQQ